jgi:myo-inositol-1(or 4)-monophosphatase
LECGDARPDAEYVWVLDPIDGTKSFISGVPLWGTLIALMHNGMPAFGMMHQPYIRERFFGDGGAATFRGTNGQRHLSVRRCTSLADATLFATTPQMFRGTDRAAFDRVEQQVRLSRYGGDCYAYCMLATGHIDLVIEAELKPYDIAALIPIVTGAGGVVTTWDGAPAQNGGRIIAAGDPRVHEAALKLLRG